MPSSDVNTLVETKCKDILLLFHRDCLQSKEMTFLSGILSLVAFGNDIQAPLLTQMQFMNL
jgi:hypothetical protein